MSAPGFGIIRRQQDLRRAKFLRRQGNAPRMCEHHLSGGCGGLLFFQRERLAAQPQHMAAKRDCAAGYNDDILAIRS